MVFSGNLNLTKKTFQLSKYYQWWEDNQKKSGFVNSVFVFATEKRGKTIYFHHWFYFFTWFNTEFDPHLLKYSLFSFFFTQTLFFFKTYKCNTKFMWCSYKFFSWASFKYVLSNGRPADPNWKAKFRSKTALLPTYPPLPNHSEHRGRSHLWTLWANLEKYCPKIVWNLNLLRIIWLKSKKYPWPTADVIPLNVPALKC